MTTAIYVALPTGEHELVLSEQEDSLLAFSDFCLRNFGNDWKMARNVLTGAMSAYVRPTEDDNEFRLLAAATPMWDVSGGKGHG